MPKTQYRFYVIELSKKVFTESAKSLAPKRLGCFLEGRRKNLPTERQAKPLSIMSLNEHITKI